MNIKNLVIIFGLISAILMSFFMGGYHTLSPIMFLIGLVASAILGGWKVIRMDTRDLIALITSTLFLTVIDEYAHTSVGTFTYFDHRTPSPLTVFGWGLFLIIILTVAEYILKILSINVRDRKVIRPIPALLSISLIPTLVRLQGYTHLFNWLLFIVYAILGTASLFYSYKRPLKWNISIMISSLAIGSTMEFIGVIEGLWFFHFLEPLSLFIAFTWPLRTWTVLALCLLFKVDFCKK